MVRDQPAGAPPAAAGRGESLAESLAGVWQIIRDREFQRVAIMGSCFSAPFTAIGARFGGPHLTEVYGLGQTEASYALLAMMLAFNDGTVAYGPLDRWFNTRKYVVLGGVVVMVLLLEALAVMIDVNPWLSIVLLVAFSFATPMYPVLMAHSRGFVPAARAGRRDHHRDHGRPRRGFRDAIRHRGGDGFAAPGQWRPVAETPGGVSFGRPRSWWRHAVSTRRCGTSNRTRRRP